MNDLTVHPFAERFPMMTDAELDNLADSIKRNGCRVPVKIRKADGWLIDGRNRLAACNRIGVKAPTETVDLDELATLELIADLNIPRRHLTQSQKSAMAVDYAERIMAAKELDVPGTSNSVPSPGRPVSSGAKAATKVAADKFGVSESTVNQTRTAIAADPENAKRIAAGEISAKAAAKQVREAKRVLVVPENKPDPGKPNDPKDKLGNPIPESLRPAFEAGELFSDIEAGFGAIKSAIEAVMKTPAREHVKAHISSTDKYHAKGLEDIRYGLIQDGRPHCVCQTCDGTGKVRIDPCKSCKGCGWLTKHKQSQIAKNAEGEANIARRSGR